MSAAYHAALSPRVFYFEGPCPDTGQSPRGPTDHDPELAELDEVLHTRRGSARRHAGSGTGSVGGVHRPTKLSQARAVTARCRREQREAAQAWPAKQPWVAARWSQRVCTHSPHLCVSGTQPFWRTCLAARAAS